MKYRKKPVVVEAVQWFSLGDHPKVERPWRSRSDFRCPHCSGAWGKHGVIKTMEDSQDGGHFVCPADWIICGVVGEYYACKPDVFERTYEPEATLPEALLPKGMVLLPEKAVALAWRIAKERRDETSQAAHYAEDAERELQELSAAGFDKHLPSFEEVKLVWNANLDGHVETDRCGFDRSSSIGENRYVCECGWRQGDTTPSPLLASGRQNGSVVSQQTTPVTGNSCTATSDEPQNSSSTEKP